jgi:hypothetical protein
MSKSNPGSTRPAPRTLTLQELALAGGGASDLTRDGSVAKGQQPSPGQFPYQVSLRT